MHITSPGLGSARGRPVIPGFDADNPFRSSLAKFVLPSADEWHKAAYYDPNKDGGSGGYWDYPTGSDEEPLPVSWGTHEGTAVYDMPRTDPPAGVEVAGGLNPYGVMGMGGNVWEYEEVAYDPRDERPDRPDDGLRGGAWASPPSRLY